MSRVAVIAGVGPGLGAAIARKFAREGCAVALLARSESFITDLQQEIAGDGATALAVPVDIADAGGVASAFARVRQELGPVDVLVNHASHGNWKGLTQIEPEAFEAAWRVTVFGAFLCSREAAADMLAAGAGTILFTGATSSVRGREGAVGFSSAKFGARGLADAMARELWPKGIHVAHVVVDGVIDTPAVRERMKPGPDEPLLHPEDMAESYWHLVQQGKSSWTFELDLRPFREDFFV